MEPQLKTRNTLTLVLVCVCLVYLAWNEYRGYMLQTIILELQTASRVKSDDLKNLKASSTESAAMLARVIEEERVKSITLEEKVGTLDKLSKSDPQLLKKYSKVYFLNENYTPISLRKIPEEYTYTKTTVYQSHADMLYFLQNMIDSAKQDGVDLLVVSAFRSFSSQVNIKSSNKVVYGIGTANQFSAEQGFSEHQLGTTIDFTTSKTGVDFSKFETTKEYEWLKSNAYKYGFAISYPKGNKYYAYEPWHWRFIGINLATKLHVDGKYLFDLDQKVIDTYLIKMFDR